MDNKHIKTELLGATRYSLGNKTKFFVLLFSFVRAE